MSDLSDIRDGLKSILETANPGITVYTYPPDEGVQSKPALVIEHDPIEYHNLDLSGNSLRFNVHATLYLFGANSREVWNEMDKYRSPTGTESIKRGLRTDDTLGSKVDVTTLISSGQVERDRDGMGPWEYSCQFTFGIIKSI